MINKGLVYSSFDVAEAVAEITDDLTNYGYCVYCDFRFGDTPSFAFRYKRDTDAVFTSIYVYFEGEYAQHKKFVEIFEIIDKFKEELGIDE